MSARSKFEAASRARRDATGTESGGESLRTDTRPHRDTSGAERRKTLMGRLKDDSRAEEPTTSRPKPKDLPKEKTSHVWPLPGLAPMTRVRTSFGDVHAAALREGDEVLTRSGEYRKIQWLTRICLDEQLLAEKPDCNPVVLAAGALAPRLPAKEISLSPRQIIIADGDSALKSNVEAAALVTRAGVRRLRETGLSYTLFHVGEPAEIYCEGIYLMFPLDA